MATGDLPPPPLKTLSHLAQLVEIGCSYSASWMGFVVGAGGSRFLLSDVPAIIVMSVLWRPEKGQDGGIEACRE